MTEIIDFKEKQQKAKEVAESILKTKAKPTEESFRFVWGMLEPRVESQWIVCRSCHISFKLGIAIKPFLETIKEVISMLEEHLNFPILKEECPHCKAEVLFAIKNVGVKVYPYREDATPWESPPSPKAS